MFIGVDGSGSGDPDVYRRAMSNSFIQQFIRECPETHKQYFRGPDELSLTIQVTHIAMEVETYIQTRVERFRDTTILLAGYSRGGATCIAVAQRLLRHPWASELRIECMALFDAVDRDISTETELIPWNVRNVYHAIRDPAVESRWYFGNCGTRIQSPGRLITRRFRATHAGMGGLPWGGDHPVRVEPPRPEIGRDGSRTPLITEEQDRLGSTQVEQWMRNNVRPHRMVR
jgi:pimeloyl-ACP methyl ester carboxylesterase